MVWDDPTLTEPLDRRGLSGAGGHAPGQPGGGAGGGGGRDAGVRRGLHGPDRAPTPRRWARRWTARHPGARRAQGLHAHAPGDRRCRARSAAGWPWRRRLAEANIITNKNLIPADRPADWDRPGGLRMGTIEVTRLGMGTAEMERIAEFMASVLVDGRDPAEVKRQAIDLRAGFQEVRYCFTPAQRGA